MSYLVLTTVGTSAVDPEKVQRITNSELRIWANEKDEYFRENERMERLLGEHVARLFALNVQRKVLPAEIASLSLIRQHYKIEAGDDSRFVFLASETVKGRSCAAVVAHAFRKVFQLCTCAGPGLACAHIAIREVTGIQHKDPLGFSNGVNVRLPHIIEEEKTSFVTNHPHDEQHMLFNFTGSYKGLIPYATALCDSYRFEMLYLFQDSPVLFLKKPRERTLIPLPEGT